MKKITALIAVCAASAIHAPAYADDMGSTCEVVTMELKLSNSTADNVRTAKFHDAGKFVDSVYDGEKGFQTKIDGSAILAVMCTRKSLLPTLRDLPLIKTGLPLSLSQDFDSPKSGLLTLYDDGTAYKADYIGPDDLAPNAKKLDSVMEIINLQRLAQ